MSRLYVAYGSNLHLAQMTARCPSATIFGVGRLNNWELIYRGREGNAHATIAKKKGSSVPVLVWSIQPFDERRLDMYEGYPQYYFKQNVMVDVGGQKKKAMVYIMDLRQRAASPSPRYIETIRQGYMDNDMDLDYFEHCLAVNAIECKQNL